MTEQKPRPAEPAEPAEPPRAAKAAKAAKRRGRPRDPGTDSAVLRAVRHRLAVDGYSRMTIAGIAADAGVTRPTIYRRWPTKLDLVTAALDYSLAQEQSGGPARDLAGLPIAEALTAALHRTRLTMTRPEGMALIGGLLVEEQHTPELMELARQHAIRPRLRPLIDTLRRGQREGEIRADLDIDTVVTMLHGSFYSAHLRTGRIDEDLPEQIMAVLWPAIAAGGRGGPGDPGE